MQSREDSRQPDQSSPGQGVNTTRVEGLQDGWAFTLSNRKTSLPVTVRVAHDSSRTCSVMHMVRGEQERLVDKNGVDKLMEKLKKNMTELKLINNYGLVHLGGKEEGKGTWNKLGRDS